MLAVFIDLSKVFDTENYAARKLCSKRDKKVQELKAFALSVVTNNDEHTKFKFKRKRRG